MLAHKAVHEGKTAAEAATGMKSFFDAAVIPSVAYTDPEVAWVGLTENEAKAKGIKYGKGAFPWAASGRSLALGRDEGMTKLLFDEATHRVLGCGIVGPNAGELVAEAGLAIEMGADASDIGLTIHAHPDPVRDHRHGGGDVRGHHHRPDRTQEEALTVHVRRGRRGLTARRGWRTLSDWCPSAEVPVFEPLDLVIDAFAERLGENYRAVYGKSDPDHAPIIRSTARLALERIAGTDAVYHDLLHTLFVTDVGQAILRGRVMSQALSPSRLASLHRSHAPARHRLSAWHLPRATRKATTSLTPLAPRSPPPGARPTPSSHRGMSSAARHSSATAVAPRRISMSSVSAGRSSSPGSPCPPTAITPRPTPRPAWCVPPT